MMFQGNPLILIKYKLNILKKPAVKMPKYGEMVSVCQENIKHFCISKATHGFGVTRAVQTLSSLKQN